MCGVESQKEEKKRISDERRGNRGDKVEMRVVVVCDCVRSRERERERERED